MIKAKFEHYYNINKTVSDELKQSKEENAKKSKQAKENWRRELEQLRQSQQAEKEKVRLSDALLDKANERVEKRKLFIAHKMKEITKDRFK